LMAPLTMWVMSTPLLLLAGMCWLLERCLLTLLPLFRGCGGGLGGWFRFVLGRLRWGPLGF
jgi:hypothetical protein